MLRSSPSISQLLDTLAYVFEVIFSFKMNFWLKKQLFWTSSWPFLKACVHDFVLRFYFSPNGSPSKAMKKWFSFHLKISFRSGHIQFFFHFGLPLFFFLSILTLEIDPRTVNQDQLSTCNCLNKKLVTHFVWYLDREILRKYPASKA